MWDRPEEIVEFLNKNYEDENRNLTFLRKLNDGNWGAILFLCQAEPRLTYVDVKSFRQRY